MSASYNGWKNRATWNVSLWINNDESLYLCAKKFVEAWKAWHGTRTTGLYRAYIVSMGLAHEKTPDRFQYISKNLCYPELNEMMAEIC